MSDSLRPHESQHARPPCPSPTPGVHSDSRPSSQLMPSSHLILCRPLLLLPPIPPSIRVISNESTLRMRVLHHTKHYSTLSSLFCIQCTTLYFPGGSDDKESVCNAGDLGSIPGLGRSLGGEHGNPLQYSCLENSVDRGTWWDTVRGVTQSQAQL